MEIKDTLKQLGLEEKESAVYLALLELKQATVLEVAKKSGIKRPTAYVILNQLSQKGMVSRVLKNRRTFYAPEHPRKLVTEAELRLKEIKSAVPQLESLMGTIEGKPGVMIYEGKENLDIAYDESFAVKGEILYMSTLHFSQEVFQKTFRKMDLASLGPNFSMRELVDDSERGKEYQKKVSGEYRKIKRIPATFLPFAIDIGIFGNRVLITSVKKEYFTVSIQSAEISRAFRQLFEAMWQVSII